MGRPKTERNGDGEEQEMSLDTTAEAVASDSPVAETKVPVKQVVFRSIDKNLILHQSAASVDVLHGIPMYKPGTGVRFEDNFKRFDDIPENQVAIKWIRNHPMNNVKFKEVPDFSRMVELPTIAQMQDMSIAELKALCVQNVVTINETDSKDAIILALLKAVNRPT